MLQQSSCLGVLTAIVLRRLLPLAVELYGVATGHVVDNLLLHEAVGRLHDAALAVILGGGVDLLESIVFSDTQLKDTVFTIDCFTSKWRPISQIYQCTDATNYDKWLELNVYTLVAPKIVQSAVRALH